jgi:hypothetical protein
VVAREGLARQPSSAVSPNRSDAGYDQHRVDSQTSCHRIYSWPQLPTVDATLPASLHEAEV